MDPLAHSLTGIALANAGIKQRVKSGSVIALVLASNMLDIDVFGVLFSNLPAWTYRRMWTHSLFTAPLLVLLAALIFSWIYKHTSYRKWCLIFLLGAGCHIGMDLINSYGVVLLFPLSAGRFDLSWVFIIDLYVWGILLLALIAPPILRLFKLKVPVLLTSRVGLCCLFCYFLFCAALQQTSLKMLAETVDRPKISQSQNFSFPEPFGPWRFRGVTKQDNRYDVYLIRPLSGSIEKVSSYLTDENDPLVRQLINSENGQQYQWFFKAPVWSRESETAALVGDLQFRSIILNLDKPPFTYHVTKNNRLGSKPPQIAQD